MVLHALLWLQVHVLVLSSVGLVGQAASCLGASQGNAGVCHPKLQHSSVHGSLPHWGLAAHPTAGWPQLCAAAGAALMFQLEENSHL